MKKNKTETHTENIQIPITPDLKKKIKSYCKLSKTSQNKFIESLINNFFKNKILSNDFIKLDKPFYFNLNELIYNKCVSCSTETPPNEFENYYTIDKIPNNLDKYDPEYKTFCYNNNVSKHKGIIINCFEINNKLNYYYLIFELRGCPFEYKLKISLIKPNELIYNNFDLSEDMNILKELKEQECDIKERINKENELNKELTNEAKEFNCFKDIATNENIKIECKNNKESSQLLFKNFFILRPYYLEYFLKTIIYLMRVNPEIKNYIERTYNINIDLIQEFKTTWQYNSKINLMFNVLSIKENKQGFLNLNTLLNMELKNISLSEAINETIKNL